MSKVVGIDLGTTNSLVAFVKDGIPVVIRDGAGDGLVPSVVSVAADGAAYVGREAQRRLLTDAARTVYSVKRFMGKGIDDVRDEARHFPFRIAGEAGGVVRIGLGDREFTAPEISAFILRELKRRAGGPVERTARAGAAADRRQAGGARSAAPGTFGALGRARRSRRERQRAARRAERAARSGDGAELHQQPACGD